MIVQLFLSPFLKIHVKVKRQSTRTRHNFTRIPITEELGGQIIKTSTHSESFLLVMLSHIHTKTKRFHCCISIIIVVKL